MSANANDMTLLLKKIERRLGLIPITPHLPKEFQREAWADIIRDDTMITFSRFFPNRIKYVCIEGDTVIRKDGWYYLKDDIIGNNKVLGVTDLNWVDLGANNLSLASLASYGYPETYGEAYYGSASVLSDQMTGLMLNANINSMFSAGNSIYLETDEGNPMRFKVSAISGRNYNLKTFTVNVLIEHKDLATISPTKMNTFEALAQADVANFLYSNLKYYDGLETIYATVDLKLNDLSSEASKRDTIIEDLRNAYVTFSNVNEPLIMVN